MTDGEGVAAARFRQGDELGLRDLEHARISDGARLAGPLRGGSPIRGDIIYVEINTFGTCVAAAVRDDFGEKGRADAGRMLQHCVEVTFELQSEKTKVASIYVPLEGIIHEDDYYMQMFFGQGTTTPSCRHRSGMRTARTSSAATSV